VEYGDGQIAHSNCTVTGTDGEVVGRDAQQLEELTQRVAGVETRVQPSDFLLAASQFTPLSLRFPPAWVGHVPFAAWLIQVLSPKIFVELGTHSGNSFFAFCQAVAESGISTRCYAVDTWRGDEHSGPYDETVFLEVNAHLQQHYAAFAGLLRMTFDEARAYFTDGSVSLLHIDGLHTYEAARHDFESWLPKLAPGAVVLLHDTNVRERNFGIWKLWEELQGIYPYNLQFAHSHGLGVLQLNDAAEGTRLPWLEPGSAVKRTLAGYFASLGARQVDRYDIRELREHVTTLTRLLAERDAQLAGRDDHIGSVSDVVAERDARVAPLVQTTVARDEQIAALTETLAEHRARVASLTESHAARDAQIARLTEFLAVREEQVTTLIRTQTKRKERLAVLAATVDSCQDQISVLARAAAASNEQLARIMSSRSMRITAPLRSLRRAIWRPTSGHEGSHDSAAPKGLPALLRRLKSPFAHRELKQESDHLGDRQLFDAEFYLKMYPDIRDHFREDPYEHFVSHGKAEGRLGCPPPFVFSGEFERLDPDRSTVLVVSHEASTTGAPVVSLNIIWELKAKYNVVAMPLLGGSLTDDLRAAADVVVGPVGSRAEPVVQLQIDQLLERCGILFAVVNSVESRAALAALARHFIPAVALIHEFASYTRPRSAVADAIFWASETFFSAEVVRNNAVAAFPDLAYRLPPVIPQGRCSHTLNSPNAASSKREAERIRKIFRPAGWPVDTPVVLGVGSVQLRKGVDLFASCAARVTRSIRCRFVWIGNGYDPDRDAGYSVYLEDQIERGGLENNFAFMSETSQIDVAYEHADVLIVSSRLDPLPNVSVDAASRGLPIVCFDRATGMADILRQNGLAADCVAPFLDVEELALRVIALLEDTQRRRLVSQRLRDMAAKTFNMTRYVERIENAALESSHRAAQECVDCATIADNAQLDLLYLAGRVGAQVGLDEAVRRFVRSWQSGVYLRKPYAGFHPGIYRDECGIGLNINPLADYMRAGCPVGPWIYDVVDPSSELDDTTEQSSASSVALNLHVFYPDLAPVIIERLNANRLHPDLFISVPSGGVQREVELLSEGYEGNVVDIQVVPNRGRDIGAFLTAFGEQITDRYEFIGHFHTKKTAALADKAMGESWFEFLLENLIGGRYRMVDTIVRTMTADSSIGLIFPDDPHVVGWTKNWEPARQLMRRLEIPEPRGTHFNFPIGTMFWARSAVVRKLVTLNLTWDDYPEEPSPPDGTILHALERLLPFVARAAQYRSVATRVPGVTR
jgi:glycosyltransferase involved in cell wall biosynthesis